MPGRLQDRIAIVTGAGRGNGRAIALGFAREGASVVVPDWNFENAQRTAKEVEALGRPSLPLHVDVSQPDSVAGMVSRTVDRFGRIDILVNNAGVTGYQHFLDITLEEWDRIMSVNLRGLFLCSQAVAREMVRTGGGVIIHMASKFSNYANPEMAVYCASKGGVRMLSKTMALDLSQHNIRVNALEPGFIVTDLTRWRVEDPVQKAGLESRVPLGRLGKPEDLVGAAIFLACDESAYLTGTAIQVDGGSSAW